MNKFKYVLSLSLLFLIGLTASLCSLSASANISVVDGIGYYSDYLFEDKINSYSSYSSSNAVMHTLSNSDMSIFYQDTYAYCVLNLDEIFDDISKLDKFYCILYLEPLDAETYYLLNTDLRYQCQFTYCDYTLFELDGLNQYGYSHISNNYPVLINFNNYGCGVDIDRINNSDIIGWVFPISPPVDTAYTIPSIVFKFPLVYISSLIGSISGNHNLPYQFMEDYQYNATAILYNNTYAFQNDAYDIGYNDGFISGKREGNSSGYQNGYSAGYTVGLTQSSQDYGIKDLFFTILDMPIMLMQNLFSFTIFDSSAWILIVSFLAIGFIIWLLRKFLVNR